MRNASHQDTAITKYKKMTLNMDHESRQNGNHHTTSVDRDPQTQHQPQLCSFCAAIDFEALRPPNMGQLRHLNVGGERPSDIYPFKMGDPGWYNLGTYERIQQSAPTCRLCQAVCDIVDRAGILPEMDAMSGPKCMCEAQADGAASVYPPSEVEWKGSVSYIVARRMTLRWRHFQQGKDEDRPPGPAKHTDSVGKTVMTFGCLQACDLDPKMSDDPFDDDVAADTATAYAGRLTPELADIKLMKRWIDDCERNHDGRCKGKSGISKRSKQAKLLRLIDVENQHIVTMKNIDLTTIHYISLSYVWGLAQKLRLLRENLERLEQPGSLVGQVSQTIEDAINLTHRLGYRYIWVDALCIIQDCDVDKSVMIRQMARVYQHAELSIVAASGQDASASLPGICKPRQSPKGILVKAASASTPSLYIVPSLNPGRRPAQHYSELTIWSSRAWTLQEKLLSRKSLIITDRQVYFSCANAHYCEETHGETRLARYNQHDTHESDISLDGGDYTARRYVPEDPYDRRWWQASRLMCAYAERRMTQQGDALDAFAAVIEELESSTGEKFVWGLPAARLEYALIWEPYRNGMIRRDNLTTLPMTEKNVRVPFPSWSWLGWQGSVKFFYELRYAETGLSQDIQCYVLRNHPLRLVSARYLNPRSRPFGDDHDVRLDVLFPSLCSKTGTPTSATFSSTSTSTPTSATFSQGLASPPFSPPMRTLSDFSPSTPQRTYSELVPQWHITAEDMQKQLHPALLARLPDIPSDQLLFFWTEVASLPVRLAAPHDVNTSNGSVVRLHRLDILDPDDASTPIAQTHAFHVPDGHVPEITPDGAVVSRPPTPAGSPTEPPPAQHRAHFIAIAIISPEYWTPSRVVLQVVPRDHLWCRVNVADVPSEAWQRARPIKKLVALG